MKILPPTQAETLYYLVTLLKINSESFQFRHHSIIYKRLIFKLHSHIKTEKLTISNVTIFFILSHLSYQLSRIILFLKTRYILQNKVEMENLNLFSQT